MTGRILYECMDVTKPSGGVRRLYRHVEILHAHGARASILHHAPGFTFGWFASDAPVLYWDDRFALRPDDVLVIPEGHMDVIRGTADACCTRVIIALNWANIYAQLPIGKDWRDYGIRHVIAGSNYEAEFIRRSMGLDSVVVASGTDGLLFRPAERKQLQIAYMPRKNADAYHVIAGIFRSRFPRWAHVPFVPIDLVTHREVASTLAASAVFLATSVLEGLARPPLEAMASGCVVVGFAGRGSLEYMEHGHNCLRADDLDVVAAAEYLDEALERLSDGGAARMVDAARATARRYSLEREEAAVLGYWRDFLEARGRAAARVLASRAAADAAGAAGQ